MFMPLLQHSASLIHHMLSFIRADSPYARKPCLSIEDTPCLIDDQRIKAVANSEHSSLADIQ